MFTPLFLSVALASANPTQWQYEHHVSSFTNEQTISLVGKNPDNSEFSGSSSFSVDLMGLFLR
ncbi:hypothetical protein JQC92_12290 [Shewanella sp. 202IG2-18]|uniref:hypothetical protein n=1 Tax=Parashewanella hymeniacidonis TaxID=2807618 RepID=UPI00195F4F20|nr:hypothetical protein [Parashewanella hymeniacidonis]MBM7072801.1 hypothetical protein [Parashewanella hymeniacidonis]